MFCSLFSNCLKVLGSPRGAIRWFSPFLCKGMRKQTGSLTVEREQGQGEETTTFYWVLIPAGFSVHHAWSLLALELCVPAHSLNSSLHVLRIRSTGQSGCPGKAGMVFPRGWWLQRLQHLAVSLQINAVQQEAPGLFLSLLLLLGEFGLQDSLCCLSPLRGVNNGVHEAGDDRSGCCRVAHSRYGGECAYQSVSSSGAVSGARDPPSSFTGPHFRGAFGTA